MKYKVKYYQDNKYQVVEKIKIGFSDDSNDYYEGDSVFQGSLSDCEAYIRLYENGFFD